MKILLLHSDDFSWKAKKKAIKSAEDVEKKLVKVRDALVVFTAVEKGDGKKREEIARKAVKEILDVFEKVKAKAVVVYPYVHLSGKPSPPDVALVILKEIEGMLKDEGVKTYRAPFGWYKAFTISVKGHPLSELSREISLKEVGREEVPEALKKEETLKSEWFILEPNGKMHKIEIKGGKLVGFDFSKHENLMKFAMYEMAKSREVKEEPPHIKLMRKLQLVDYEPASDPGHFRYMPNGKLIKSLLEDYVSMKMVENGAMEVETPIMYDYEHPALKNYMNRFPARQYTIETPNKRVFLRFSACFGQFLLLHDASISYKDLPLWLYELTRYSFRVEQRGELAGLRRLRAFTMPDCHAFTRNMEQAKGELMKRFRISMDIQKGMGISPKKYLELAIRIVDDFYKKNREFIEKMVKEWGKPVLVEKWEKRFFYFVMKYEFNFVDALDKAAALTTDQIDIENAERYGIQYTDSDNQRKYPVILHLSPSGAIERVIYALLEKAYMEMKKGKNPVFPLWLAPVQVRICPVSEKFTEYAKEVAENIKAVKIRVDVDDRDETVPRKIQTAESEWVNIIVVVGEREKKSGKLAVRFRETGKVKTMSLEELVKKIKKETEGFPFRPLPVPMLLSKRPVFFG